MDIRSFFKPLEPISNPSVIENTKNDSDKKSKDDINNTTNIAKSSRNDDNINSSNFLDSDSDTSPKTTRLKKKSKHLNPVQSLFDGDDDEPIDNKISIRQLCNLETNSNVARQVNLTDFFENSTKTQSSTTSSQVDEPIKPIKNTDFTSYLEQMDLDRSKSTTNDNVKSIDNNTDQNKQTNLIKDKKFVFTGVLTGIDRDDAIRQVKKLGGYVVSAVSDQIDYLVYGELLEDGRPYKTGTKYKKFCDLNKMRKQRLKFDEDAKPSIELIDEQGFIRMIDGLSPIINNDTVKPLNNIPKEEIPTAAPLKPVKKLNIPLINSQVNSSLWVDKYAPRSVDDIISNQLQLKRLKEWLVTWKSVNATIDNKKRGKGNFKCALLSGPPGIGKTTSARLIVQSCGYSLLEFNASDQRNKQAIDQISILATGGITLTHIDSLNENTCILMDEVDGISGNDRGGSQAIHRMIDKSVCPIICICNDRNAAKIRTLANKCLDLKFTLPSKILVVQRLKKICHSERISITENILDSLCDSRQCDIRQCINALQFLSKSKTPYNSKTDSSFDLKSGQKDNNLITSAFDIVQRLFNPKNSSDLTFINILDYYFIDYEMVPLMVQENYVKFIKDTVAARNKWSAFCTIADSFVIGDVIHKNIYSKSAFGILPELGFITTVLPVFVLKSLNSNVSNERLDFPKWLGKLSSSNKNKRLLHEFSMSTSGKIGTHGSIFTDGLVDLVCKKIMNVLLSGDMNSAVDMMVEFGVTRDFLVDGYTGFLLNGEENLYNKLSTKDKSAFTRRYNSQTLELNSSRGGKGKIEDDDDTDSMDDFIVDDEEDTPRSGGIVKRRAY